jgi:hypothetical protein
VAVLLDAHLRRLEEELARARRELAGVRGLLESEGTPAGTRVELPRGELRAALGRVRFAVGTDPALPMLGAVLLEVDPEGVRLVATDRFRMAFGRARGRVTGPPVRALVPVDAVDALAARLAEPDGSRDRPDPADRPESAGEPVTIGIRAGWVTVDRVGEPLRCAALPYEFPGYQQLLRPAGDRPVRRVPVRVAALTRALRGAGTVPREHAGVTHQVTVLGLHDRQGVRPLDPAELAGADPAGLRVGVNGGYLLEALAAAGSPELVLELTGPNGPVSLRHPGEPETCSLLMPVRL